MSFFESFEHFWHSEDFEKSLNHTTPPQKVFEVRKSRRVKEAVGITAQAEVDDR